MFTGIVKGLAHVCEVRALEGAKRIYIDIKKDLLQGLQIGASISIDGVCLTVCGVAEDIVAFDVIRETLERTTLADIAVGRWVNVERAAKFGDEIGGHLLSGHVIGRAQIESVVKPANNCIVTFKGSAAWMKYLFPKGYIAVDGISLTLVDVNLLSNMFTVHLIPETLRTTTLGKKNAGDLVNIEIDAQTQAIVETIERIDGRSALYDRPA